MEHVLHETSDDGSGKITAIAAKGGIETLLVGGNKPRDHGKRHRKNVDPVTEAGWHLKQNILHKEWLQSRETGTDKRFRLKQSIVSHLFLCPSFEYKLHNVFFNKKEIKVSTEAVIVNR